MFLTDAFTAQRRRFTLLEFGPGRAVDAPEGLGVICVGGESDCYADLEGFVVSRYDAGPGAAYLLRPDGYVAARFRHPTRPDIEAALARASGLN